ncbi:hypothetical protein CCP3SC1_280018 [Gammaproteobacteria bacterium]
MLHSVRTKLLTLVISIVVVTVVATTVIHAYLFRTHQAWSLQTGALAAGTALRTLLEHIYEREPSLSSEDTNDINHYCSEMVAVHPALAAIGVVDPAGKRLFGDIPNGITSFRDGVSLERVLMEGESQFTEARLDPNDEDAFSTVALIPIHDFLGRHAEVILVVLRADAIARDLGTLILVSLITGLLVAAVAAALGRWGTDLVVIYPLEKLLQTIREVTARGKETGGRVEIDRADEFGTLGQAFNDMLERLERSRAALTSNEKFLEAIVENIPILLEVQEATDLRFVRFNRAGEAMLDLRREDLLGRTPREVFPIEAATRYISRDQAILAAGVPVDVPEERVQTETLGERILYTRKIPILDEQRRPVYLLGISEDITERRHLEEIRRFGAFQAGIAEMSVSVLHNIGNAITAVTDDAEQILRGTEDLGRVAALLTADVERTTATLPIMDEQQANTSERELKRVVMRLLAVQREVARTIAQIQSEGLRERAERIGRSVRHIADIVRIQQSAALPSGGAAAFSLQRAVNDALVMQGESLTRHEVAISVNLDPSVDEITTYRNRLLQALINIFKNSYEAIRERQGEEPIAGLITITSKSVAEGRLELRITDNGIGIDSVHLQDIFRFGYSTKARGSGFGLHSVANFIQEQGGSIGVKSAGLNQGAEFIIELPVRQIRKEPID